MESDIRNIKVVCKYGAFGNPDKLGFWIYGKRRDRKTVACKNETQDDGGMLIWSQYSNSDGLFAHDVTEFSKEEWNKIRSTEGLFQKNVGNAILDARPK